MPKKTAEKSRKKQQRKATGSRHRRQKAMSAPRRYRRGIRCGGSGLAHWIGAGLYVKLTLATPKPQTPETIIFNYSRVWTTPYLWTISDLN